MAKGFVSLRMPKREVKEATAAMPDSDAPKYPYGSRIEIEGDQVDEAGLDGCKAEEKVVIEAKGYIDRVETRERANDKKRREVSIQITDIKIVRKKATASNLNQI